MLRISSIFCTTMVAVSLLAPVPAKADLSAMAVLQGVTFIDGSVATGEFSLNTYGYLLSVDIDTSAGPPFAGYAYTSGGGPLSTPPATVFGFDSPADFSLVLDLTAPLGPNAGVDTLVPGSFDGTTLSGSYEYCTQSGCGLPTGTYRLLTAGHVYVTEPAAISLFGTGVLLMPLLRRVQSHRRAAPLKTTPRRIGNCYLTPPVEPDAAPGDSELMPVPPPMEEPPLNAWPCWAA